MDNILAMLLQSAGNAPQWTQPWLAADEMDRYRGRTPGIGDGDPRNRRVRFNHSTQQTEPAEPDDLSDIAKLVGGLSDGPAPTIAPQAAAPEQTAPNILQQLGLSPESAAQAPVPQAPAVEVKPTRPRQSLLDTVGRIADVFATVGGAAPLYQPTLNAREDREIAQGDHDLQRQHAMQEIDAGEDAAAGRQRAVLGQAVRGLQALQRRNPNLDVAAAWPIIAQRMGIEPGQVAELGQIFASDPNAVAGLSAALNEPGRFSMSPTLGRDANGNLTLYQLDREGGASRVDLGEGITPVEPLVPIDAGDRTEVIGGRTGRTSRTIGRAERPGSAEDRNLRRYTVDETIGSREREGEADRENRTDIARIRTTGGGSTLTPTQRGAVAQSREAIPGIRQTLNRVDQLSRQLGAASGPVGGLVPGQLAGGSAAQFDRAQALLAAQIRTLIRTAGEGSMSDYESRLNVATLPARTDSVAGRNEAIRNLRTLLAEVEARSNRLLAPPREQPAGRSSSGRPATRRPAAGSGRIVDVSSPEQAARVPVGTRFRYRLPDGRTVIRIRQ